MASINNIKEFIVAYAMYTLLLFILIFIVCIYYVSALSVESVFSLVLGTVAYVIPTAVSFYVYKNMDCVYDKSTLFQAHLQKWLVFWVILMGLIILGKYKLINIEISIISYCFSILALNFVLYLHLDK